MPANVAAAREPLRFDTIADESSFARLAGPWDALVRAMPRPSPFLLHDWLLEWWRHFGRDAALAVHVAYRGDRLVAALPLFVQRRLGLRVARFLGGHESALADLLLASDEDVSVAERLAERIGSTRTDLLDVFGLPGRSRLAAALGPSRLRLVARVEAPVLDVPSDWETFYRTRVRRSRRKEIRRRLRNLARLGKLEVRVLRAPDELEPVLDDAFRLHALRWRGRPDHSTFGTPTGSRFHRAALRALAAQDVARVVTLTLDGRTIAFLCYFVLCGRAYLYRQAFDPELAQFALGIINILEALKAATEEGLTRVEFLGGREPFKVEFADRIDPLYEGLGLARTLPAQALLAVRLLGIRAWLRLKRLGVARHLYYEGLAPARRAAAALRGSSDEESSDPKA